MRAPREIRAHAAWRHCPSNAGRLFQGKPMFVALVSVTRNGSCRELNMRSALRYRAHVPVEVQYCATVPASGSARPSCMA
jgi:hypothetical protein